ncbi:hypothetical protein RIEGSTA812A_PEG_638 [invertebrate metagenome]|uniref:Uncharacterized protein n=1 Tax=invertebrate metagenome TaxID=1711999 RepID=A0A484H6Z5_9ZZZZ
MADSLAQIKINPIGDRIGQILRNTLIDRMTPHGMPKTPRYILSVTLALSTQPLSFRRDNTAARANLLVLASYHLQDVTQHKHPVVFTDTMRAVTSYHIHDAPYAIVVAEQEAQQQAARQLADGIVERTALYFLRMRTRGHPPNG